MFSSSVTEKLVLDKLREAVKNGKFGDFSVNTSSIQGTQAIILHTNTLPFGIATQGPPDGKFTCLYNSNILNITLIVFAATFFRITTEIPLFSKMQWLPAFLSHCFFFRTPFFVAVNLWQNAATIFACIRRGKHREKSRRITGHTRGGRVWSILVFEGNQ